MHFYLTVAEVSGFGAAPKCPANDQQVGEMALFVPLDSATVSFLQWFGVFCEIPNLFSPFED